MIVLYARITKNGCKQLLHEHLLGVADKMAKVAQRPPIRTVMSSLLNCIPQLSWRELQDALYIAGLFHDIGKALWRYQKHADKCLSERRELHFPYHEIISCSIFASACEALRDKLTIIPELGYVIAYSILSHHQALRCVTLDYVETAGDWVCARDQEGLRYLADIMRPSCKAGTAKSLLEFISACPERALKYDPSQITRWVNTQNIQKSRRDKWILLARLTAGLLMAVDVFDAHEAVGDAATRYVRDIKRFVRWALRRPNL